MKIQFGKIKKISLREIWRNEATEFSPWLASNIGALGEALGMDLELETREASFGDFCHFSKLMRHFRN